MSEESPLLPDKQQSNIPPDNSLFARIQEESNVVEQSSSPRRQSTHKYRQGSMSQSLQQQQQQQQQQQAPLYQRVLGNHYGLVTNPSGLDASYHVLSSASSIRIPTADQLTINDEAYDLEANNSLFHDYRQSVLSTMRPNKLIGSYKPVVSWLDLAKDDVDSIKSSKVREYYEEQNYLIEKFHEIDNLLDAGKIHFSMLSKYGQEPGSPTSTTSNDEEIPPTATEMEQGESNSRFNVHPGNFQDEGAHFLGYNSEEDSKDVVFAILVNFFINFILLLGKVVVSVLTSSMSIVASLVDSVLDFLSTFIIYIANRLSKTKSWNSEHAYPVGRSRLEPLGILIFSVIIIISFVQVGQESVKRLVFSSIDERIPPVISYSAGCIMVLTIVCKVGCWIWCKSSKSSSVQALAQDAMTDIVFNTVSLLMPLLGYFFDIWWFDSFGALCLCIYIIISWSKTAFEHVDNLTGAVANPLDYKVILYLAYRFAELIKQITALKVYHVGDNLNVEIDVVFAMEEFDLTFRDCHDIAEALQYAIETLPMVERAFVHIDYMEANFKGHLN